MKKKLKILIPNATSPLNLGDQVMLKELLKLLKSTLPITEVIGERCFTVPLYPDLSGEEVNHIIDSTKKLAKFARGKYK
ncbi:MAG: hypothetical protein A3D74_04145 [Candidatus Levybacteria bacterium RIFCSPHIGHO2_02_FULL_37_13]|nr:MAG: hypothetical protein A3D74_04145 [Candidatus Levybacteria bacterium RIFCSPHIGHO2_02_FULL_37_13]